MDLNQPPTALLAALDPVLDPTEYAFCRIEGGRYGDWRELEPVAYCQEGNTATFVVPMALAEAQDMACTGPFRCITLQVHSSLHDVGLTAAVAGRLTACGISANVIAGYQHDHIYVPAARATQALAELERLAACRT